MRLSRPCGQTPSHDLHRASPLYARVHVTLLQFTLVEKYVFLRIWLHRIQLHWLNWHWETLSKKTGIVSTSGNDDKKSGIARFLKVGTLLFHSVWLFKLNVFRRRTVTHTRQFNISSWHLQIIISFFWHFIYYKLCDFHSVGKDNYILFNL